MATRRKRLDRNLIPSNGSTNYVIRTDDINVKIDIVQKNNKGNLLCDKDGTIYYMLRECCKLASREYNSRHNRVENIEENEKKDNYLDFTRVLKSCKTEE